MSQSSNRVSHGADCLLKGKFADRRSGLSLAAVLGKVVLLALVVAGLSGLAAADDDGPSSGPQPDVARISLIHGDVSMQRGDSGDWATATLNTPLVRGDQVATGDKSRAEIQLNFANILRLSSQSQAKIADLTRTHIQIQLSQGYAYYSTFKGSEADVEIDTPNVAVRPLKRGRYRVQVNSDEETEVVVRDGEAEIDTPQGSTTVKDGHSIIIRGTTQNAEYKVEDAPSKDDWDNWNKDRDHVIQDAQAWHRTGPYYTGAGDLDAYGRWVFIPGYGWVWQPYQDAAWAPYHDGRWVWEPYWGWTWVSYEAWGWAPYHYGRWFFWGGSWVWWPGPAFVRPVWGPAFVTFIGFGHHTGFAFGFGSIGWIPVGPFDPCYRWWGRGFNRVNVVNITNINVVNVRSVNVIRPLGVRGRQPFISNVNMALRNPRVRAGISGVDVDHFGRGDVRVRRLDVRDDDLRGGRVMTGNLPVVPTRDSLHTGAVTRPAIVPRSNQRFFTHRQPPAALPTFHDQRERVQHVVQEHAPNAQIPGAGNDRFSERAAQDRGTDNRGAVHTQPGVANRSAAGNSGGPASSRRDDNNGRLGERGGWQSFGNRTGASDRNGSARRGAGNGEGATTRPGTESRGGSPGASDRNAQGSTDRSAGRGPHSSSGAQSNERGNRGEWSKFGPPSGGRSNVDTEDKGGRPDQHPESPRDNNPASRDRYNPGQSGGDRGGFSRFPSSGDRPAAQPDRGNSGSQPSGDRGGWQRFPSSGRQDDSPAARGSDNGSRPPLELNKPIVTPREPETRRPPESLSGGYDRGMGSRPSGGGYDRGSAGRPSGGGSDRGSRGGNSGGGNRGGGGGGNHSGGGERGGGRSGNPRSR